MAIKATLWLSYFSPKNQGKVFLSSLAISPHGFQTASRLGQGQHGVIFQA